MNEREASTAAAGGDGAAGNQRGGTRFLWEAELVATYEHLVQRLRLEHEAAEAAVEQAESERAAALATGAQRAYDPNWVMMNERRTLAAKDYHSFRGQYDDLKASIAKERAAAEGDARENYIKELIDQINQGRRALERKQEEQQQYAFETSKQICSFAERQRQLETQLVWANDQGNRWYGEFLKAQAAYDEMLGLAARFQANSFANLNAQNVVSRPPGFAEPLTVKKTRAGNEGASTSVQRGGEGGYTRNVSEAKGLLPSLVEDSGRRHARRAINAVAGEPNSAEIGTAAGASKRVIQATQGQNLGQSSNAFAPQAEQVEPPADRGHDHPVDEAGTVTARPRGGSPSSVHSMARSYGSQETILCTPQPLKRSTNCPWHPYGCYEVPVEARNITGLRCTMDPFTVQKARDAAGL